MLETNFVLLFFELDSLLAMQIGVSRRWNSIIFTQVYLYCMKWSLIMLSSVHLFE